MAAIRTSSDGACVFIAVEDSSTNQCVLKASRSDLNTWTTIYNPGGGTACNLASVPSNPDLMYFYGNFGTDVTVIKHTISTATNTDVSPASLGAKVVNTLLVNPSDANEWILTVDTDEDLLYTSDTGTTYTTWDSSLGFDATALWVLWSGFYLPHRYFVAGDNGANLDILYSPNEGSSDKNVEDGSIDAQDDIVALEATYA